MELRFESKLLKLSFLSDPVNISKDRKFYYKNIKTASHRTTDCEFKDTQLGTKAL